MASSISRQLEVYDLCEISANLKIIELHNLLHSIFSNLTIIEDPKDRFDYYRNNEKLMVYIPIANRIYIDHIKIWEVIKTKLINKSETSTIISYAISKYYNINRCECMPIEL